MIKLYNWISNLQMFPNFFDHVKSMIIDFAGIDIFLKYFSDKSRSKNWIIFVADLNGVCYIFLVCRCAYSASFFNVTSRAARFFLRRINNKLNIKRYNSPAILCNQKSDKCIINICE